MLLFSAENSSIEKNKQQHWKKIYTMCLLVSYILLWLVDLILLFFVQTI